MRTGNRPTGLSIFSGVGGLDLGAKLAGLQLEVATDRDEEAIALLAEASGTRTVAGDIADVLRSPSRLWSGPSAPRVLIGGPPCTAFSHAGFWIEDKRAGKDPAAILLADYVACLEEFKPDAFVLENVPGLAFKTHTSHLERLLSEVRMAGYQTSQATLNASRFGVAQSRRRLFIVGVRGASPPQLEGWPSMPTRGSAWSIGSLEGVCPAEPDELPGPRYRHLLADIPVGGNYLHFTDRHGWDPPLFRNRGRYWSFLLKLDPSLPSPTLPAQRITYNGPFHWDNRHLRVREMARLQSFPDWYPTSPSLSAARRHIGNAVPPLLAAAVVWRTRQALGDVSLASWPEVMETARDPSSSFEAIQAAYGEPTTRGGADQSTSEAPLIQEREVVSV